MNYTIEAYTTWLDQALLKLTNMKTNGDVHRKHLMNNMDTKYELHQITPQLNFNGMGEGSELTN